jgi:hypothetical protein
LTPKKCHHLINEGRQESRVHESLRVARSLGTFLIAQGVHASTLSRTLGDVTLLPSAHQYYLVLDQQVVHAAINLWCKAVGLKEVLMPKEGVMIGSPKVPTFVEMARSFQVIQEENHKERMAITTRARLDDVIQFHNNFTSRYILQLLWAEGARCQKLSSITVGSLFADSEHIVISDRDSDRYAELRVCPLSAVLQRSRLNYSAHLKALGRWLEKRGERNVACSIRRITDGIDPNIKALPILYRNQKNELNHRPITRADLTRVKKSTQIRELNQPRHFLISELDRREIALIAINAQVGHHHTSAPAFGIGSGLSISEFSKYMKAVLEKIHTDLGVQPLVGLGTICTARIKLPNLSLPVVMPPPQNLYLAQRLQVEDFNPPDIFLAEEDCPVTLLTLPARNELRNLMSNYLKSDLIGRHPWGAVCFCLIAFDSVINISNLEQFFDRLKNKFEVSIGQLKIVEVFGDDSMPIGQCFLSKYTQDALKLARASDHCKTFEEAKKDLNCLLVKLDSVWSKCAEDVAVHRLQSIAAHLSLIDLPSVSRFSMIHKSPFMPASDLLRISLGVVTIIDPIHKNSQARVRSNGFKNQIEIVQRWANKDAGLGEYRRRANGLIDDLTRLKESGIDEVEELIHDLIIAELSEHPPYRKLKLHVLAIYLKIQLKFFAQVQILGDLPRTSDEWNNFIDIFTDKDDSTEGTRRWAGFHIGAWLMAKGYAVPQVLVKGNKCKVNYKPHLSVYVTNSEVEKCIDILKRAELTDPLKAWLPLLLHLNRGCVFRPAELRFLMAWHVSKDGQHLQITTSGHAHLKNKYAPGLLQVPSTQINNILEQKKRRLGSPVGAASSMFVSGVVGGYADYDQLVHVVRTLLQEITGRGDFRLYDFRACAITDILINVEEALKLLVEGQFSNEIQIDNGYITSRYQRGAKAARAARQSNVVTTLRYYHLGGAIENRALLNSLLRKIIPSAKYLASVEGKSPAAVLMQRSRAAHGAVARIGCFKIKPSRVTRSLELAPIIDSLAAKELSSAGKSLVFSGLLKLCGLSTIAAADAAAISSEQLTRFIKEFMPSLKKNGITQLHVTAAQSSSTWFPMLEKLSNWAYKHRFILKEFTGKSPKIFRLYGGKLSFSNHANVIASRALWPILLATGFQPLLFFGKGVAPSDRAVATSEFRSLGIEAASLSIKRQSFVSMRFYKMKYARTSGLEFNLNSSNHHMGKAGRLVVAAMTLAITIATEKIL